MTQNEEPKEETNDKIHYMKIKKFCMVKTKQQKQIQKPKKKKRGKNTHITQ